MNETANTATTKIRGNANGMNSKKKLRKNPMFCINRSRESLKLVINDMHHQYSTNFTRTNRLADEKKK